MRRNVEATNGGIMAECAAFVLGERVGRREAHELVRAAAAGGRPLREELAGEVPEDTFDAATYLGATNAFVDRALAYYRETT